MSELKMILGRDLDEMETKINYFIEEHFDNALEIAKNKKEIRSIIALDYEVGKHLESCLIVINKFKKTMGDLNER